MFATVVGYGLPTEPVSSLLSPDPTQSLHCCPAQRTRPRTARSGVWRADEPERLGTFKHNSSIKTSAFEHHPQLTVNNRTAIPLGWERFVIGSWKRRSQQTNIPALVPTVSQLWQGSTTKDVITPSRQTRNHDWRNLSDQRIKQYRNYPSLACLNVNWPIRIQQAGKNCPVLTSHKGKALQLDDVFH